MDYQVDEKPQSDLLRIALEDGDKLQARQKSIMTRAGGIRTTATTTGSFMKAISKSEQFPLANLEAIDKRGIVTLTPPLPGDVTVVNPRGDEFITQTLSFLAAHSDYDISLSTSDLYRNESLGTLTLEGKGPIFLAGMHGIDTIELDEGEQTVVYEDYLLGIDGSIEYSKKEDGGMKERLLGTHHAPAFTLIGPGTVYLHARSPFIVTSTLNTLEKYSSE